MKTCAYCGKPITAYMGKMLEKVRHCSISCGARARRGLPFEEDRKVKICAYCSQPVEGMGKRFCSRICGARARRDAPLQGEWRYGDSAKQLNWPPIEEVVNV